MTIGELRASIQRLKEQISAVEAECLVAQGRVQGIDEAVRALSMERWRLSEALQSANLIRHSLDIEVRNLETQLADMQMAEAHAAEMGA